MKKSIILLMMSLLAVAGRAQVKDSVVMLANDSISDAVVIPTVSDADSAYIQGDFLTAISMYEKIIDTQGVNASLYMNLGNAWFQQEEIAKAILCYERAYLLDPSDEDVRFNLELARTRTVDKVNPRNELFFVVWFKSLLASLDVRQWTVVTIVVFAITILFIGLLLFSRKSVVRKISLGLAAFFFAVSILSYIFATTQVGKINHRDTAIIMAPSVTVKSTPIESGTDLFIVHEGRKVDILDSTMKEWVEIRLEDGNTGWLPLSAIEII